MRIWAAALLWFATVASGVAGLGAGGGAHAQSSARTEHVQVDLAPETTAVAPGSSFYVAVRQKIIPGWHTYWRNPGDAGQATTVSWTVPPGWKAGEIVWPTPERDLAGPIMNYVLSDLVYLPVPIAAPADARVGQVAVLKGVVSWLVCKDVCIPESATLSLSLPVTAATPGLDPRFGAAIRTTLTEAPAPVGLSAHYDVQGGTLRLSVAGAAVRGQEVAHAYFFPYDPTLIDHAKPQMVQRGADGLTLTTTAGFGLSAGKTPKSVQGVLSIGTHAYEIAATPGAPLVGAAGLGSPVASTPPPPGAGRGERVGDSVAGGSLATGLLAAAGLAFLGGLVLNLMPCVFPVLSMKAAALARHVHAPGQARSEGLAFLAGVVASFLLLAGLLIAARAGGEAVGWGFQLQAPAVVLALTLVMFSAGLNLSGLFEFGTSAQGVGSGLASRSGLAGAFFTGVLAVVVAAPCTAPFMAGAIGWALVQSPAVALMVFLALALGLAAPFTALSFVPQLFARLPPPGGWMGAFRKLMAFPMYGAAAWLAWVFALQAGVGALPFLFAAVLALAFAAWMFGVGQRSGRKTLPRGAALVAAAAAVGFGVAGSSASQTIAPGGASTSSTAVAGPGVATQAWSPERVAALQSAGKPVFVDFTAAWCVTCQVNERTALATRSVADAFARTGAVYLKADWTRRDSAIANALTAQGRSGVPLYLVYGKAAQPEILPQILTPGMVVQALDQARGSVRT